VLTRKSSWYWRLRVNISPRIVGSLAAESAQLTRRNSIRTKLDRTYANFLGCSVKLLCPVIMIIVIAGDAPRSSLRLRTLLHGCQVAQLNDGIINTPCFAIIMLRYLIGRAVLSIVDSMVSRVGKWVNS